MVRVGAVAGVGVVVLALGTLHVSSCGEAGPDPSPRENVGRTQLAATGVCDNTPPSSTQACIDAVQLNGGVVNDVFTDANGLTADQLPIFGQLFNNWPGCNTVSYAGCSGQSLPPYDCPGQYQCTGLPNTFANASVHLNALDRLWWHPCRLTNHSIVNNCPVWSSCTADGIGGNYLPWEGLVFDLGGPSNQVAIFAQNDHGPQPCESLEYTVYLTDNPFSQSAILDPAGQGVDPNQWNRAVLTKIFTKGFVEVRPPDPIGHAACGDTALYSVEEDSFAQVFSLPCGINFRYAAIIAGNDGLDFPECAFDSQEAELDAVAGLTETGAAVCPDADGDHYVDCACPGAPPVCDCNDADENVNPGEPEPCDSVDINCDNVPGSCDQPLVCHDSICIPTCVDESASCPTGSECTSTPQGNLCVPSDCTVSMCPVGSICVDGQCVPACDNVVCPGTQICQDGQCIDPCKDIACPSPLVCQLGTCVPPCECFQGDIGCVDLPGTVCDDGNTGLCVPPLCEGVVCLPSQHCDGTTGLCVDFCHPGVMCPLGQKCVDPDGCVDLCFDVNCPDGFACNPETGDCVDDSCADVECIPPAVCVDGECVDMGGDGGGGSSGAGGSGGAVSSASGPNGAPQQQVIEDAGSCGCRVASRRTPSAAWLLLLALPFARRRRT
jgi:MYXO-CTERM domain-containing protein